MKIWIDARKISEKSSKWRFITKLIEEINKLNSDNDFIIYLSPNSNIDITNQNIYVKYVNLGGTFKDQYNFSKILKEDKIDKMLFFDIEKPLFYNRKYVAFPWWAMELFYPSNRTKWSMNKLKYNILYDLFLNKASKIIVFSEKMKEDFNDKLNIKDEKLKLFTPPLFKFPESEIDINVKIKHNIKNDYLVYFGNSKPQKNLLKFIFALSEARKSWAKLDFVLLWNKVSNDYKLRDLVKKLGLERNVFFLWEVDQKELSCYLKSSIWYVYPTVYDFFPFNLSLPFSFNKKILASNLITTKEVVKDKWIYFAPQSENSIKEGIIELFNSNKTISYENKEELFKFDIKKLIKIIEEA